MIGRIQLVQSVTPLEVKQATTNEQKHECERSEKQTPTDITSPVHNEKKTEKQTYIKDKAAYTPNVVREGLTILLSKRTWFKKCCKDSVNRFQRMVKSGVRKGCK